MLVLFEDQRGCPLAHDKAIAGRIERARGRAGSSLRVERAVSALKPPIIEGVMPASEPPVIITAALAQADGVEGVDEGGIR